MRASKVRACDPLDTLLVRIPKCIVAAIGIVSRPAIEEEWEDVAEPLTAGRTSGIAFDMKPAPP